MNKTRIIMAGGAFDFFHIGHKNFLDKVIHIAGSESRLLILVNSDKFIQNYKGNLPIQNELVRVNQIRDWLRNKHELWRSDVFILPAHHDQKRILDEWKPTIIIHGLDWTGESLYNQFGVTGQWLQDRGILFVYVDRTPGISSSQLREEMDI